MANELQVVVNQTVGQIDWNFDQLKKAVEEMTKNYTNLVYTDENVSAARSDLAQLRKLKAAIDDQKKEIKSKCLEPYTVIDKQAKELMAIVEKPIAVIDSQVKDYERRKKAEKRATILEYIKAKTSSFPDAVAARLINLRYDSRWENASTSQKSWAGAVDEIVERTTDELKVLESVEPDFQDAVMKVYTVNLSLTEALNKAKELRAQKNAILERERARVKAEEEAKRLAAEMELRKQEAIRKLKEHQEEPSMVNTGAGVKEAGTAKSGPAPSQENSQPSQPELQSVHLYVCGTSAQLSRIKAYINFAGAKYKEVL